jgi:hypothetical protein
MQSTLGSAGQIAEVTTASISDVWASNDNSI